MIVRLYFLLHDTGSAVLAVPAEGDDVVYKLRYMVLNGCWSVENRIVHWKV